MVFVFILRWFSASSRCFFGGVGLMKLSPLVELGSKISSTKSLAKNWAVSFPQKITTTNEATRQYKSPKKNNQPNNYLVEPQPTHLCIGFSCWMLENILWKLAWYFFLRNQTQIFLGLGDPNRTLLRRMRSGKHLPPKVTLPPAPKLLQL